MFRLTASALILWLSVTFSLRAETARRSARELFDVRYHPGSNGRHTLDLFLPAVETESAKPRPVVLFVHGGTWMAGDKNFFGLYRGVGRFLAANGFVGVLINYRLSPLVRHPEHVKDVARAFAWVRKNISRYRGDPDCIFLAGHSAGGHLACLLATDQSYLKDPRLRLDDKDRQAIKGVVAVSGVYRIPDTTEFRGMAQRTVDILVGEPGTGKLAWALGPSLTVLSRAANPFALVFGKDRDIQRNASPLTHVKHGLPPFLILTAEREVPGLWKMAEDFVAELKKHKVPVDYHDVPHVTHKTIVKGLHSADEDAGKLVLAFLQKHTNPPR